MEGQLIVQKLSGNIIDCMTKDNKMIAIQIETPWDQLLKFIEKYMLLYVKTDEANIVGNTGLLVLDPHHLISVTSVVSALVCPRKNYVNFMGAEDLPEKANLKRMMEGNLMHDIFSEKISIGCEVSESIPRVLDKMKHELISLDINPQEVKEYLSHDAKVLDGLSQTGQTEIDNQNWKLGLHGKFDGIIGDSIIELKTSKIPESTPWPDHNLQMITYMEMMRDREDFQGKVLYVNNGNMGLKFPTKYDFSNLIIARNYAYLVQSGKYVPKILRGNEAKPCKNCFQKAGCIYLCAGLGTQRDCNKCSHEILCDKVEYDKTSSSIYLKMVEAITGEQLEQIKLQGAFSKVGFVDNKYRDYLSKQGNALITKKKVYEDIVNGEYVTKFEYDTGISRFRKGDFIRIYPLKDTHNTITIFHSGIITKISKDFIEVVTRNSLPQSVTIIQSVTVFQATNSKRAVYRTITDDSTIISIIKSTLHDKQDLPKLNYESVSMTNPLKQYNRIQYQALQMALSTPDLFLIQGPAGTGKTSLIIELLNQLLLQNKKILCSAYTNMAVDNVAKNLKSANIPFIRLGNEYSMDPIIHDHSVMSKSDEFKDIMNYNNPGIILSTTSTISKSQYDDIWFDYVLLDEAAQMTEPDALKAILLGEKAILVGDHAQLQPIILSDKAKSLNLHISLFERLQKALHGRFILLTHQYRMNDEILKFPNEKFYRGELKAASDKIANHQLDHFEGELISNSPYDLIVINDDSLDPTSQVNFAESRLVIKLVHDLIVNLGVDKTDIGIITPFRAQVAQLRALLPSFLIDTVDRFQGSEKEIIIFSTITPLQVPILTDERRLNVALTRARKKLVVITSNPVADRKHLISSLYKDALKRNHVIVIDSTYVSNLTQDLNKLRMSIFQKLTMKIDAINPDDFIIEPSMISKSEFLIYYNSILLLRTDTDSDVKCSICRQQITDEGIMCGCGYFYHYDHLIDWLRNNNTCPVCKHKLSIVEG